jgi:hypothetical protein
MGILPRGYAPSDPEGAGHEAIARVVQVAACRLRLRHFMTSY